MRTLGKLETGELLIAVFPRELEATIPSPIGTEGTIEYHTWSTFWKDVAKDWIITQAEIQGTVVLSEWVRLDKAIRRGIGSGEMPIDKFLHRMARMRDMGPSRLALFETIKPLFMEYFHVSD
jgi:predicted acetyltransferase